MSNFKFRKAVFFGNNELCEYMLFVGWRAATRLVYFFSCFFFSFSLILWFFEVDAPHSIVHTSECVSPGFSLGRTCKCKVVLINVSAILFIQHIVKCFFSLQKIYHKNIRMLKPSFEKNCCIFAIYGDYWLFTFSFRL